MAMFEKGKGEVLRTSEGSAETIVGSSVKLKGNLKSDGDLTIYGFVTGELKTKGSVKIGPEANVIASIKAKNVLVAGAVQGNIEASDELQITETGKVLGDVSANVLSIAAGATFSGKSQMADGHHKEVIAEPVMEEEATTEELKTAK